MSEVVDEEHNNPRCGTLKKRGLKRSLVINHSVDSGVEHRNSRHTLSLQSKMVSLAGKIGMTGEFPTSAQAGSPFRGVVVQTSRKLHVETGLVTGSKPTDSARLLLTLSSGTFSNWIAISWVLLILVQQTTAVHSKFLDHTQRVRHRSVPARSTRVGHFRELQGIPSEDWISPGLGQDQAVLLTWKTKSLNLPATWVEDNFTGPCRWPGVGCGLFQGENRVTVLNLLSLNLTEALPSSLANLSALTTLSITGSNFSGGIPPEFGNFSNLQVLNLSHCLLGNLIPVELGRLTNLRTLDLSGNNLTGTIPAELFTNCSNLATFNLSSNLLNSTFPPEIGNCRNLRILDLGDNTLHGEIPVEIGQLAGLENLVVAECSGLNGSIPDPLISGCKNLTFLDLSWNKLTGEVPPELGNISKLVVLNLQGNWLGGALPDNLGQLKQLRALAVGSNNLTGTLPQSLTQCTSLLLLDVSNNSLAGAIPSWLSLVPTLEFLAIQNNRFSGPIPVEITKLSVLKYIDASNNSLEGSILPAWGGVETLRFLRLSNNKLTGIIPQELGSLYELQCLDLSSNALTGTIPSSLGQLQDLLWLQLGKNYLTGMIPKQLTNCTSLMWINLSHNNLIGEIPPDFATLGSTADKVYQKNRKHPWDVAGLGACTILSTWIPDKSQIFDSLFAALEREKCQAWLDTVLRGEFTLPNQLGKQKVLGYWQLNDNNLTGRIPDLSNSTSLGFLALGNNQLSGSFPTNITHLPLYDINVSHNNLNETIPASLGHSQLLISLDMSFNNLTGGLPTELGNLDRLIVFNISYNNRLRGKIPTGGQMTTLSWYPYVGDPNLCFVNEGILKYLHPPNDSSLRLPGLCPNSTGTPSAAPGGGPAASLIDKMKGPLENAATSIVCSLAALLAARTVYLLYKRWRAWHQGKDFDMLMDDSSRRYSYFKDKGRLTNPVASFGLPALKALTYADLVVATDNFSPDNILGDGGFGIVYRAQLRSGTIVAVKKLIQDGAQGQREFQAEMETLGTIQHGNLVSLLGYCCNNEEKILVYELLKYGSLDDWLHESDIKAAELDWKKRLQIALGTARGLAFLHHDCVHQIIHRDMKSSNILLDENFEAFLTDFGMARIMDVNCTHVSTIVAGTPGYVPPEYSQTWKATTKGDVYSFGVVLLELVAGKRPTGPHFNGLCGSNLVERVRILEGEGRHEEACDQIVLQSGNRKEIDQFLNLGILCTNVSPTKRPSMKVVTTMLEDIVRIQTNTIVV